MIRTGLLTLAGIVSAINLSQAGGEVTQKGQHQRSEEIVRHYASRNQALAESEQATQAAVARDFAKPATLTFVAPAAKDKYGDPMYGAYGPLPFSPGSPMYDGPRYAASFDRYQMLPIPDGNHRGYYRQAYSNPTLTARSDVSLAVGATYTYMQHGMLVHPGSMAPSSARVMTNNRW